MKAEHYHPDSRLSVAEAATYCRISEDKIRSGMMAWKRSGRDGLRYGDDGQSEGGRRRWWTTPRWIADWHDRLSVPTTKSPPVSGLVQVPTKDFLKTHGFYSD